MKEELLKHTTENNGDNGSCFIYPIFSKFSVSDVNKSNNNLISSRIKFCILTIRI